MDSAHLAGPPIVPSLADVGQEPASSLPSPSYLQDGDNERQDEDDGDVQNDDNDMIRCC